MPVTMTWRQGGAYALLVPRLRQDTAAQPDLGNCHTVARNKSGSNGTDSKPLSTQRRNIAQVFQFPVIYDTMTVGSNLAFPEEPRRSPGRDRGAGQADRRPARPLALPQAQATRLTAEPSRRFRWAAAWCAPTLPRLLLSTSR